MICERLDRLPDLFSYIKPQGAYYIFPKFKINLNSVEFAKKLLYEARVAVVPGIGFGENYDRHVRISFGGLAKEIDQAFERIEAWWKNNKSGFFVKFSGILTTQSRPIDYLFI